MKRRDTLKALALGGLSVGALAIGCKTGDKKAVIAEGATKEPSKYDRFKAQAENDDVLLSQTFFTPEEMATIAVLSNIIIPADDVSGSATDAGVPSFIEFMAKDKPEFQVPLRGGLRWLDLQSNRRFAQSFTGITKEQQLNIVDDIAFPAKAKPEMQPGVRFFNLMRDLTASGFYTTEMGWKDIGYVGNKPNEWKGVPPEVLQQYNLAYTPKDLKECI